MALIPAFAGTESHSFSHYTRAGALLPAAESERDLLIINTGWLFYRGDCEGWKLDFDDSQWQGVNLPHGVDGVLPEEASGGRNYRGTAWYRRHFDVPANLRGKRLSVHFEGIMGKSELWVNGELVKKHFGGYLPLVADVSPYVKAGERNLICIKADNSDDKNYPPGKPQDNLDFTYFGGIYRDAYLQASPLCYITDPNEEDIVAGGGIFFRTMNIKNGEASCRVSVHVRNSSQEKQEQEMSISLGGKTFATQKVSLAAGEDKSFEFELNVPLKDFALWNLNAPTVHDLRVSFGADEQTIPVGIRTLEFSTKGVFINGEKLAGKLMGVNRHQDYAHLGHAVSDNLQVQDVRKLKEAGIQIIRLAHTPADPAFMDACDRLGVLVVVPTPGWQFCGDAKFVDYVYSDIKNMIRRDRNRPSVGFWEPILNETFFPEDFAKNAHDITHAEYPVPGCATATDSNSKGSEHFDIVYAHPQTSGGGSSDHHDKYSFDKPYFTREFGDNVDDWSSHNSPSRTSRAWGEVPMLIQAKHYLKPDYSYTCWETLYGTSDSHLGGTLWHCFDHQRGYHPDPFYGGIMDAFRQPKLSYFAFMAQRPQSEGAFVYIAHGMTPFSPHDVTVYSNCDEVRLSSQGRAAVTLSTRPEGAKMPHSPAVFPKAWDFQLSKKLTRERKTDADVILVEGLVDGKVVATQTLAPSRRTDKISLRMDGVEEVLADGSTVVQFIAEVQDAAGVVKRLNNEDIFFEVEGPAEIVGDASVGANPRRVQWGTAPVLLRVGKTAGKITLRARLQQPGTQAPRPATLEFSTLPDTRPALPSLHEDRTTAPEAKQVSDSDETRALREQLDQLRYEYNKLKNAEVERDQHAFEGGQDKN